MLAKSTESDMEMKFHRIESSGEATGTTHHGHVNPLLIALCTLVYSYYIDFVFVITGFKGQGPKKYYKGGCVAH